MSEKVTLGIRLTKEEKQYLQTLASNEQVDSVTTLIKTKLLQEMPTKKKALPNDFRFQRLQRKSFRCPEALWQLIEEKTTHTMSTSQFIRQALLEKLEK